MTDPSVITEANSQRNMRLEESGHIDDLVTGRVTTGQADGGMLVVYN